MINPASYLLGAGALGNLQALSQANLCNLQGLAGLQSFTGLQGQGFAGGQGAGIGMAPIIQPDFIKLMQLDVDLILKDWDS